MRDTSYYRARYYDSGVGRFINEDPLQHISGINFYRYVANRPTISTDPSGLVTVIPLPATNIRAMDDIDASCVSATNPTGKTAGGCNKVTYSVDWTGCKECDHRPSFTITLKGSIFVATTFPYKGRHPWDTTVTSTEAAIVHEQHHTDDEVQAILPIFSAAEHAYPSEEACEQAAQAAAIQAAPAWDRAAAESQRRRH